MGNKMRQLRKLELGDASTSEPCDAPDSSIAGPTESQIINEQEILDILDSDTSPMPEPPIDGGRDEKDDLDLADMFVPHSELTVKLDLRETAAQTRRDAEERENKERNPFEDTTGIKVYPFVKTRVSWMRRVLGWFRRD